MVDFGIGAAVRRKEDFRFLTGQGTYTDDINRPGQLHAFLLRSPHAHAELGAIDTAAAKRAPGVAAVFTGADLQVGGLPCGWLVTSKDGKPMIEPPHPLLAQGKVRHVGDPVAVVIAETREQAKDAAELIDVSYKPLSAVVTSDAAIKPGTASFRHGARQSLLRLASGRQGSSGRRVRPRQPHHASRPCQQSAGLKPDGAARRHRRIQSWHQ